MRSLSLIRRTGSHMLRSPMCGERRGSSQPSPSSFARISAVGIALAASLVWPRASLPAQARPDGSTDSVSTCLRFMFSPWTPALAWHEAGHQNAMDSSRVARDDAGRGWAAPTPVVSDTILMLFPPWWPAGVSIQVGLKQLATRDTVVGEARALIADANRPVPTSRARVWRVPCGSR